MWRERHLQHDCPHKETDDQVESMDDPNAYAGRSEQIIRINQPITVATRDNIYKQMGSQRTKANICHATGIEDDPKATLDIQCLWRGGTVALI